MCEWYNLCKRCSEYLTKEVFCENCVEELKESEYLYRLQKGDIETELE